MYGGVGLGLVGLLVALLSGSDAADWAPLLMPALGAAGAWRVRSRKKAGPPVRNS